MTPVVSPRYLGEKSKAFTAPDFGSMKLPELFFATG
jgi:hypothetical protein